MPDGGAPPRSGRASGSGFIVSADGYVLTNAHVIDSSTQVTVRLLDRREFPARIVGTDPTTDVAVLKIEATGLTAAPLGDSDKARVGEWVLAIGNPLGENLTFTVTQGIISAKGRSLALPNRSQSSIQDFIQTDAAINPGNSGGPLINVRGEVIGINGAIASPTGFSAGYGFAVPINLARAVMSQIRTNGRVERAALGVLVRDATTDDAAYVGLADNRGVVVQDFGSFDSPARRAGLQPGDVIISVDKRRVDYVAQLQEAIAFRKPGETVDVEVARKGGQRATFRVPLQRSSPVEAAVAPEAPRPSPRGERSESTVPALGITVAPIDATTTRGMEVPEEVRGVIVTDVDDDESRGGTDRDAADRWAGHHRLGRGSVGDDAGRAQGGAAIGEARRDRVAAHLQHAGEEPADRTSATDGVDRALTTGPAPRSTAFVPSCQCVTRGRTASGGAPSRRRAPGHTERSRSFRRRRPIVL